MTAATSHRLDGLEPDNLLAFLALLGLLRALELESPEWKPRAYWDLETPPLRPFLTTFEPTTPEDICRSAVGGLQIFQDALRPFSWPRSKQGSARKTALLADGDLQRRLSKRCISAFSACLPGDRRRFVWQLRCELLATCGSSRLDSKKGMTFDITPLKLPSGQMSFIGAQYNMISICKERDIHDSLFKNWTYGHKGNSLRFSPEEARRYAYRASDPSLEGSYTELGASALSGLALLTFTISDAWPHWRMVAYSGRRSEGNISWPIWNAAAGRGASFRTISAILRSLSTKKAQDTPIRNLVQIIATARRYVLDPNQGDYGNVSRASLTYTQEI